MPAARQVLHVLVGGEGVGFVAGVGAGGAVGGIVGGGAGGVGGGVGSGAGLHALSQTSLVCVA
jgi:hypothetical protein